MNKNIKVTESDRVEKGKAAVVRNGEVVWIGTILGVIEVARDGDFIALHPETFAEQKRLHDTKAERRRKSH